MKLKDSFAIITGASTGIGRAIALEFAKEGCFIALIGRNEKKLEETKEVITKFGGHAEIFIVDLAHIESINTFISKIKENRKRIDILVNVAGIWHGEDEVYAEKKFETFSQKVILDTYAVGLIAPTLLSHACIPLMQNGAKILNISGTFANGAKGWLPYFVSKKGIEDLTIGLAEELIDKKIQVNAISPSDVATDAYKKYFPQYIQDAITPEEIGMYATYLCSHEGDKTTGKIFVMKKGEKVVEGYHK